MAMTFSSQGCRAAAADLTKSANALDSLLNSDLTGVINMIVKLQVNYMQHLIK